MTTRRRWASWALGALLTTLTLLLGTAGLAGASSLYSGPFGGWTLTRSELPNGYHVTSLGTLYADAGNSRVSTATVNTVYAVVLFTDGGRHLAAQFVAGTEAVTTNRLLSDGVNVTVSTADSLGGTGQDGGVGVPLSIIAFFTVTIGAYAVLKHRGTSRRWPLRRRASSKVGIHTSQGSSVADVPTTTFDDVAGAPEAVEDLREIVDFLTSPERFERVGATRPKGALLVGPPGTGKTLLARAVAGEAKVPFFSVSGSDFMEMFVGVGAKRVRELFGRARKAKRAIIFIDEIDAVAKRRGGSTGDMADAEHDRTLVALLNEMDGFTASGVVVLAATNRPDVLDPAILRPGRLDRRIEVPRPDRRGREMILLTHAKSRPLDSGVDLALLARRTGGLSGADLKNLVNEASIHAARAGASTVSKDDFEAALMTVIMGRARTSAVVSEQDRTVTAWHEAGHAVAAYMQEAADPPVSVSIIPRGAAGGVTAMSEGDNNFLQRSTAAARLVSALGGRAAEEGLLGGDFTQGAHGDLSAATALATDLVTRYGMTSLGLMVREKPAAGLRDAAVETAVENLLGRARDEALRLLQANAAFVELVANELLEEDTIDHLVLDRLYEAAGSPDRTRAEATLVALYGEGADHVGRAGWSRTARTAWS